MKTNLAACLVLCMAAILGLAGDESIDALVKKLGSSNFQERARATNLLRERPEAVPALRAAAKSADSEAAKRAAEILDFHERRPVREMSSAVKEGDVERLINLVATLPAGKFEQESWEAVSSFVRTLIERHEKSGGEKFKCRTIQEKQALQVLSGKRVTESAKPVDAMRWCFLRFGEMDVDFRSVKPGMRTGVERDCVAVVGGSARVVAQESLIILAGGDVHIEVAGINAGVIVSGGNIRLKGDMGCSLLIARGKVVSDDYSGGTRIISGKTVERTSMSPNKFVTENESNPLGYVRWSAPSKNAVPLKAK